MMAMVFSSASITQIPDPPLDYDLAIPPNSLWSDEPEWESKLHLAQIMILLQSLEWLWRDQADYFTAGNMTVYYSPQKIKQRDFRGPDFFVCLNCRYDNSRKSWVVWEEGGQYPNVIVEILSDSTAEIDRTTKKELYEQIFRTPNYYWFDPLTLEFAGFALMEGHYQPIEPTDEGLLWSGELGLYLGVHNKQVRYFSAEGQLIPTLEEENLKKQNLKMQEQVTAERERADRLAAKLRDLGIED